MLLPNVHGVVEAKISLKPGRIIQPTDLMRRKSYTTGHAFNPITGPFNDQSELVGRVVTQEISAGEVITGAHLVPLSLLAQQNALRRFWTRCC